MMPFTKISTLLPAPIIRLIKPIASLYLQRRMKSFFENYVSQGDLVFDVGAHEGEMTRIFLELGAQVVCIEPNPSCIEILKKRYAGNKKVKIAEVGVSDKTGKADFWICEDAPSISTFSEKWKGGRFSNERWKKRITVQITTLDSLISEFGTPSFCKIDIEGFELSALKGLSLKIPHISFEFTREFLDDADACMSHISSLGNASFNFSIYSEYKLMSDIWLDPHGIINKIKSIPDKYLCGDIFAKLD